MCAVEWRLWWFLWMSSFLSYSVWWFGLLHGEVLVQIFECWIFFIHVFFCCCVLGVCAVILHKVDVGFWILSCKCLYVCLWYAGCFTDCKCVVYLKRSVQVFSFPFTIYDIHGVIYSSICMSGIQYMVWISYVNVVSYSLMSSLYLVVIIILLVKCTTVNSLCISFGKCHFYHIYLVVV
jgi:hypothetical protein